MRDKPVQLSPGILARRVTDLSCVGRLAPLGPAFLIGTGTLGALHGKVEAMHMPDVENRVKFAANTLKIK